MVNAEVFNYILFFHSSVGGTSIKFIRLLDSGTCGVNILNNKLWICFECKQLIKLKYGNIELQENTKKKMGNSCSCPRLTRNLKRHLCCCCGDCINSKPKTKENLVTLSPMALETTTKPSATTMTPSIDTTDGEFQSVYGAIYQNQCKSIEKNNEMNPWVNDV